MRPKQRDSYQSFRSLITPRLAIVVPILPLPTHHSLALIPLYLHSLVHTSFNHRYLTTLVAGTFLVNIQFTQENTGTVRQDR